MEVTGTNLYNISCLEWLTSDLLWRFSDVYKRKLLYSLCLNCFKLWEYRWRKLIFINSNDTYPAQSFSLVQVEDAVKSQEASVHSLGGTSFRRGYRAAFATLPIKSMDFWFDSKTGLLKRIEILYRNHNWEAVDYTPHVTITYENYVLEKKATISHFFMESRFVVQKSGQFVASPALMGYKVIDNTKWWEFSWFLKTPAI